MRLWLDGEPGLAEPMEELALKVHAELTRWGPAELRLPLYTSDGLSVRLRFVHELPKDYEAGTLPPVLPREPAIPTLAWYWSHVLQGLLWESPAQVAELHARREWGRVAGVGVAV